MTDTDHLPPALTDEGHTITTRILTRLEAAGAAAEDIQAAGSPLLICDLLRIAATTPVSAFEFLQF